VQLPKATWRRACVCGAIALCTQVALAQSDDGQRGLNQIFRALQGFQQGGAGSGKERASPAAAGGLDSVQNVEAVVKEARERKHVSGTTMGSDSWCTAAANPLRPGRLEGTGWRELVAKCTAALEEDERSKEQAAAAQELRRAETERAQNAQARKESEDYEARRQALLAGLKGGTIQPKNCAQWMVGRGLDQRAHQGNEVSRIAYRPPQGTGYFEGVVQQIQGENILVRLKDHLAVVAVSKSTQIYRDGEIAENGSIGVVGQQTGSRALRRSDGSANTVAVVTPSCVVGAPNWLMDVMPE
jgi:hypothetical protein